MSLYATKRSFAAMWDNQTVNVKEELHRLIEGLDDEHARELLDDLQNAADVNGPPLDFQTRASLDRGLADISADRVVSLEEFENKHPL